MDSCSAEGLLMMLSVPLNKEPMYSTDAGFVLSPKWLITTCFLLTGLGPFGFAYELSPLPLVTYIFSATTLMFVGYQPTGINPFDLLLDLSVTSKTAMQLLSALAT